MEDLLKDIQINEISDPRSESRSEVRYQIEKPCCLYRVLPNGDIDLGSKFDALIWDVSRKGFAFRCATQKIMENESLLVATEGKANRLEFQNVCVLRCHAGEGPTRLHAKIGGPLSEVFESELLIPTFQPDTMKLEFKVDQTILATLGNLGAIESESLDFVQLCPQCNAIPTVRLGCARCLSAHVKSARMIHHYACANVDFEENFDFDGEVSCRKCRARRLIVGADFEYLEGPNRCEDCHQANLEKISIGHCMSCGHRFPMSMAETREIKGYRVSRLDLLALVNSV